MSEAEPSLAVAPVDEELKKLTLDLFTEIAILEHLIRNREPTDLIGLDAAQFGILNYFCRLGQNEARMSLLAWSFQESEERIRDLVGFHQANGWLTVSEETDPCVRPTEAGRAKHAETIMEMAPIFVPVVQDIPREDLETTVRTLMDLRRTFDNLPDR